MVVPIPELSLVLVASQVGRIAIIRCLRHEEEFVGRVEMVFPRERVGGRRGGEEEEEVVDWESRPAAPLLGIAAGPVQSGNRRGRWRCGRWRVWGVWMDGTVGAWQVGRGEEGDGVGIGGEEVVGF